MTDQSNPDRWAWMPRYIAIRLAEPDGSPLEAMARAKAETEARTA